MSANAAPLGKTVTVQTKWMRQTFHVWLDFGGVSRRRVPKIAPWEIAHETHELHERIVFSSFVAWLLHMGDDLKITIFIVRGERGAHGRFLGKKLRGKNVTTFFSFFVKKNFYP
ncbi:MAG: hypothetical protein RMM98_12175 [Acidobacteriota bacterium]|nr:hypothetical protein [Blastocatellia bacterium]MDW8240366.1 hypothetical protein [Acidobacteriota bacterium]